MRFHAYLDGGTPEEPAHIVVASLLRNGKPVEQWDTAALTKLPKTSFQNDFAYQTFKAGPYGIVSGMGAAATITLPETTPAGTETFAGDGYILQLISVNDSVFHLLISMSGQAGTLQPAAAQD